MNKNKIQEALMLHVSTNKLRPEMHRPFRVGNYVYATDAHSFLKIHKDIVDEEVYENDKEVKYPDVPSIERKTVSFEAPIVVRLADIQDAIHRLPTVDVYELCVCCDGEGTIYCDCCGAERQCDSCKGTGKTGGSIGKTFDAGGAISFGISVISAFLADRIIKTMQCFDVEEIKLFGKTNGGSTLMFSLDMKKGKTAWMGFVDSIQHYESCIEPVYFNAGFVN